MTRSAAGDTGRVKVGPPCGPGTITGGDKATLLLNCRVAPLPVGDKPLWNPSADGKLLLHSVSWTANTIFNFLDV